MNLTKKQKNLLIDIEYLESIDGSAYLEYGKGKPNDIRTIESLSANELIKRKGGFQNSVEVVLTEKGRQLVK